MRLAGIIAEASLLNQAGFSTVTLRLSAGILAVVPSGSVFGLATFGTADSKN